MNSHIFLVRIFYKREKRQRIKRSYWAKARHCFFYEMSRPLLGPTQPPVQVGPFRSYKAAWREANHLAPSRAQGISERSNMSTSLIRLHGL
jgi:hypothetical protein